MKKIILLGCILIIFISCSNLNEQYISEANNVSFILTLKKYDNCKIYATIEIMNKSPEIFYYSNQNLFFNYKNNYYRAYSGSSFSQIVDLSTIEIASNSRMNMNIYFLYDNNYYPFNKINLNLCAVNYVQ